jgi:hypothetical protein
VELQCFAAPGHRPQRVALDPTAAHIASAGKGGELCLFDVATAARATLTPAPGRVIALSFSAGGQRLACRSDDGRLHVWDVASQRNLGSFATRAGAIALRALPPQAAAQADLADALVEVHRRSAAEAEGWTPNHSHVRISLAVSPDGHRIAAATIGGAVRLWDAVRVQPLLALPSMPAGLGSLRFTADGSRLVVGLGDGEVVVLHASHRDEPPSLRLSRRRVRDQAAAALAACLREEVLLAEVVRRLEQQSDLSDEVRDRAVAMARARGGDGVRLVQQAWSVASLSISPPEHYASILRAAQAAAARDPDDLRAHCVLGLSQARVGQWDEAAATLRRVCAAAVDAPGLEPLCLVQLAVLLHRQGRHDEGRALLTRLQEIAQQPRHRHDLQLQHARSVVEAAYASAETR